jgi:hypothetical protein
MNPEPQDGDGLGKVTPAADVFSLGCVLGELFLDGTALFDLSQVQPCALNPAHPTPPDLEV